MFNTFFPTRICWVVFVLLKSAEPFSVPHSSSGETDSLRNCFLTSKQTTHPMKSMRKIIILREFSSITRRVLKPLIALALICLPKQIHTVQRHLKFSKIWKVALNTLRRIFLNFAKGCILSLLFQFDYKNGGQRARF